MKRIFFALLIFVIGISAISVAAQEPGPDDSTMPWQTSGPTKDVLAWQIAVVARLLGYPVSWPPESLDNGAQSLIWLDIGTDDPLVARDRVLCGLSLVFPKWRSSRPACQR